jgi:glycosyltransferase involved in cell wall biosynthesis
MKKPIICQLSDFSPEYPGSFIDALLSLSTYCRNRMQLETFCLFPERARGRKWLQRLDAERVLYDFIPKSRTVVFDVHSLLKSYNTLVFHTHFFLYDMAVIFLKLLFYKSSRVVWHLHGMSELTLAQRAKDIFKVKILGNYYGDQFISVGHGVYQDALIRGFREDKLILAYNGIDINRFIMNAELGYSFRESLGISKEHYVFLLIGWSPIRKGVDIFIRAAEELYKKNNQKVLFLVVGRKQAREFISSLPQSSRLGPALRLIDPVEDFSLLLNSIDVLVSASRSEGFSYAILEAMAARRLILCSDIAGVPKELKQVRGVRLFPSEDWKMLSELMEKVQSLSPVEREPLRDANFRYVADNFSLERWTEQMGSIYRGLLQER